MVRITTLALLVLSASSAFARPTHRRRSVCKASASSAAATATVSAVVNLVDTAITSSGFFTSKTKTSTKTRSSTSASATATGSGSNGTVLTGSTSSSAVFPVSGVLQGWSVASTDVPAAAKDLTLTSSTLIVTKQALGSSHPIVTHEGKTAIQAYIPKGALIPGTEPFGGFSFYSPGARSGTADVPIVSLDTAKEVTFSYSIYFESGFEFNLGGKLPGIYGGETEDIAVTCSGGRHNPKCFSARLMFRANGAGELYLYVPPGLNGNDDFCGKAHNTKCNSDYGESVGRGSWTWETGNWMTVSERILLNTPGEADGEAEIYINGQSVLNVPGITWRSDTATVMRGIQMQVFFGGHESNWASPKDQNVWFADFSVGILQTL